MYKTYEWSRRARLLSNRKDELPEWMKLHKIGVPVCGIFYTLKHNNNNNLHKGDNDDNDNVMIMMMIIIIIS